MPVLAKEIMSTDILVFHPGDDVRHAAKSLVERGVGGAPVIDDEGKLVGMLSESDLIVQDATPHYPTYIRLLDSFIALGGRHFEKVLKKVTAAKVADLMTTKVISAREHSTMEELATAMTDNDISRIPIVDADNRPIGMVTKTDIVRAMSA